MSLLGAGRGGAGGCQVRCAGCRLILSVAPGHTEFVCSACQLPQMLPPGLASWAQQHQPQMVQPELTIRVHQQQSQMLAPELSIRTQQQQALILPPELAIGEVQQQQKMLPLELDSREVPIRPDEHQPYMLPTELVSAQQPLPYTLPMELAIRAQQLKPPMLQPELAIKAEQQLEHSNSANRAQQQKSQMLPPELAIWAQQHLRVLPPELSTRAQQQHLQQMLPPEFVTRARQQQLRSLPRELGIMAQQQQPEMIPPELPIRAPSVNPTKIQLPCVHCKAILHLPHGFLRFPCPHCGVHLAYDLPAINKAHPSLRLDEVDEVVADVEREEDEGGEEGETFTDYHPPKLSLGPPHPDPIVETSSLAAIQLPVATYNPKIMDFLMNSEALSCLQIETLVYACQRHLQHLQDGCRAGFFLGDGAGVGKGRTIAGLIWELWHHGRKKALWISVGSDLRFDAKRDLKDVGGMCIEVHPLNKLTYAKLDSKAIKIREGVVFCTYSCLIASSEKGRSRLQQLVQWCGSNFDGLIVFDECHKAKNLVPEAGGRATQTGKAVLEIQTQLPEARVIYCSATGASEPRNMGYMARLGLWGDGTCFPTFQDILVTLDKKGVGVLELVAMDMKARGMYACRTLSYKDAEFDIVEAPLDTKMMEMYKKATEFWAYLRMELVTASTAFLSDGKLTRQLWLMYWAGHQRFFRHMCISAKVPLTVKLAKQALMENKCVVIGLQSTGEARTDDVVTKYGIELDDFVSGPRELLIKFVEEYYPLPQKPDSLAENMGNDEKKSAITQPDASPRGRDKKRAKYNRSSDEESEGDSRNDSADSEFQVCEESETDSDNESFESEDEFRMCLICSLEEESKKMLHCSCCGKVVHPLCLVPPMTDLVYEWSCHSCKSKTEEYFEARDHYIADLLKRYESAIERKLTILEVIRSLDLPNNPLDNIIDQLGGPTKVSEMTGRRGMLVRASSGKGVTYQARNTKDVSMEMVNMHEKQMFMDGEKLVSIISEAGSSGVSLQADKRAINQKRRVHITLELPWSADRTIQQFGRTHRSNQASAPQYRLLFTNLGGERRFASVVAKRLESLGALTQGDRRAGPSLRSYNYDSLFGKKALSAMYRGIMEQVPFPVLPPGCSSDNPETLQDFITRAYAALDSVGLVRDSGLGVDNDYKKVKGYINDKDLHDVGRFLNRLLGLPPDIQNRLFELFVSIFDVLIQNARNDGHLDTAIVDMKAKAINLHGTPKRVHVDKMSGASTELFTFTLDRGITWEDANSLLEEKRKKEVKAANDGFYESRREWMGRGHFILAFECSGSEMYKIYRPAVGESVREISLRELRDKYVKTSSLEKARRGWEDEYAVSSKQCMHGPKCKNGSFCSVGRRIQEVNVLAGLVLPIWRTIENAFSNLAQQSHQRIRVVSIETTTDRKRIVGLLIPNGAVRYLLQDLAWVEEIQD